MTVTEFSQKLDACNTVYELKTLRDATAASKFISMIKLKIAGALEKEGFTKMELPVQTLKGITSQTDTNCLFDVDVPAKNRTFAKFKRISCYVNHKSGRRYQTAEIFIREIKA